MFSIVIIDAIVTFLVQKCDLLSSWSPDKCHLVARGNMPPNIYLILNLHSMTDCRQYPES